jgi:hypothetical protein
MLAYRPFLYFSNDRWPGILKRALGRNLGHR